MKPALEEGKDFYYNDEGLLVLTAEYHKKRGHCCTSGCLHCPFEGDQLDPSIPMELQLGDMDSE